MLVLKLLGPFWRALRIDVKVVEERRKVLTLLFGDLRFSNAAADAVLVYGVKQLITALAQQLRGTTVKETKSCNVEFAIYTEQSG